MKYSLRIQLTNTQFSFGSRSFIMVIWVLKIVDSDQLRTLVEANQCQTVQEMAHELDIDSTMIFQPLKSNRKSEKAQQVASTWIQWKSNCCYEVCSVMLLCNKPLLDGIVTAMKSGSYTTTTDNRLHYNEAPKYFSKPKLHQKKVMDTIWWSAVDVIQYSCLNPGKTITAERSSVEKLMKCTQSYIQSQHWSVERDQSCFINARWHISHWMLHKLNELSCKTICFSWVKVCQLQLFLFWSSKV
jgi:hypothetical protein